MHGSESYRSNFIYFFGSECSDIGLLSELCFMFLNYVKNPALAQQKNIPSVKVFFFKN